ncbi:MAG: diguanylate cyclase [Deltaproteobacteria bacterium]|nr:diguanylate cyclase [Deltaproteobacteria bacterium]
MRLLHRVAGRIALLTLALLALTTGGLLVSNRLERERASATTHELREQKRLLVERILELNSLALRTLALDYTRWDDMVAFVEAPTAAWAAENIDTALATYGADAIWILRTDGAVAYAVTAEGHEALATPPWDARTVPPPLAPDAPLRGFFAASPDGPVEVFGAPIQPDTDLARRSPPRGFLYAGRAFDDARMTRLGQLADAELRLEAGPASEVPTTSPGSFERPLPGPNGTTVARLHVRMPTRALEDLQRSARRQLWLLIAGGAASVLFAALALAWWVGRPVRILSRALDRNDPRQLDRLRRDRSEFGELAGLLRRYFAQRAELQRENQERKLLQEHLEHVAHHDTLTGLPNRKLLLDRLRLALARSVRSALPLAVAQIDLDGFKAVNDTLGHATGDALLRQVAARLVALLRKSDTVARTGGDEFVLVLPDVGGVPGASAVVQRVVEALGRPFEIDSHTVRIGGSVGVALFPGDGADEDALLGAADAAMYRVKESGRGAMAFASPTSDAEAVRRTTLLREIAAAVPRGELAVTYRPVVVLPSGRLVGARALLGWADRRRPPEDTVELRSLVADSELAHDVGDWMLRTVAADLARWLEAGLEPGTIILPLCARRLRRRDTLERVRAAVAPLGPAAARLQLAVPAEAASADVSSTAETLSSLKRLGLRTALQGFGAGRGACLQLVCKLPLDELSFGAEVVSQVATDRAAEALVAATAALADRLGTLRVVADDVAGEAQARALERAGCRTVSGDWTGPACNATAFAELVRAGRPRAAVLDRRTSVEP